MRTRIYNILEMTDPQDFLSRAFSLFIVTLISLNVLCIVLESIPELDLLYRTQFFAIEIVSTVIFALEYSLRLWSCVESETEKKAPLKSRIKYALSPLAIVDLLAFLPSILQVIFPGIDLRFLRVLRLLRVFKLTRYFTSFELLLNVLHE